MQVGHLVLADIPPDPLLGEVGQSGPTWASPRVPCADAAGVGPLLERIVNDPLGYLSASATLYVTGDSTTSVGLAAATLGSPDPAAALASIDIADDRSQAVLRFAVTDRYETNPYPFWILAFTTGGAALVRFDPVPVMDDQRAKALAMKTLGDAANCFSEVDPFFRHFHRLNPIWAVDPGIESHEYIRLTWGVFQEHLEGMDELRPAAREMKPASRATGPATRNFIPWG
jgi:hypothetical protein